MYTEDSFRKRPEYTEPEIKRASLASIVLVMEDLGISADEFDFIDPIGCQSYHEAHQTLIALGAMKFGVPGLTETGRQMAQLPLAPHHARMIHEAMKYGCVKEALIVVSFLSFPSLYIIPKGKEKEANEAHRVFKSGHSDARAFLRIWDAYLASGCSNLWCYRNFLNSKTLSDIDKTQRQLMATLAANRIIISESKDDDVIDRSVAAGLIYNLFEHDSRREFRAVFRGENFNKVYLHPNSDLFRAEAVRWFVAAEIVRTTKPFARVCVRVKREWLQDLVPHLFTYDDFTLSLSSSGRMNVNAVRQVFFNGKQAGKEIREVSAAEAKAMQIEAVRKAKQSGWKRLVFRSINENGSKVLVSKDGYRVVDPGKFEADVAYYCTVEDPTNGRRAIPKFRMFDFCS